MRFHTQTAGCSLTAQQPENNIVRVTLQALAAVLGGTQSLHTNSMDEALALPGEKAVRIALRTQHILAHESGVTNTVDPLAGSYFIESLTSKIEKEAMEYIERLDEMGGVLAAIESGYIQREIAEKAYEYQRDVEERKKIIVGVNKYEIDESTTLETMKVDPAIEEKQKTQLGLLKASRDKDMVEHVLKRLEMAARSDENLMPVIIEAVKSYATLGEISDVLRDRFGEYRAMELF